MFYTKLTTPELVNDYFEQAGKGSVVDWWNPEQSNRAHLLNRQMKLISGWIEKLVNQSEQYKILEIGVGKGRVASALWRNLPQEARNRITYYGLDINKVMLEKANARFRQEKISVSLRKGRADILPLKDAFFDAIICLETVVHLPLMKKVLKEWMRVVKPGGIVISDVDNLFSIRRLSKSFFLFLSHLLGSTLKPKGEGIFKAYTLKEYQGLLTSAGFKIKKIYRLGFFTPIDISIAFLSSEFKNIYLMPPWLAKYLEKLNKFIENTYPFSWFSEYIISLAVK